MHRRMRSEGGGFDAAAVSLIAPSLSEPAYSVSERDDESLEASGRLQGDVGAELVMNLFSSKCVIGAVCLAALSHDPVQEYFWSRSVMIPFPQPLLPFARRARFRLERVHAFPRPLVPFA